MCVRGSAVVLRASVWCGGLPACRELYLAVHVPLPNVATDLCGGRGKCPRIPYCGLALLEFSPRSCVPAVTVPPTHPSLLAVPDAIRTRASGGGGGGAGAVDTTSASATAATRVVDVDDVV